MNIGRVGFVFGMTAFTAALTCDVVQLATVLPAKLRGEIDAIRVLDQTPRPCSGITMPLTTLQWGWRVCLQRWRWRRWASRAGFGDRCCSVCREL